MLILEENQEKRQVSCNKIYEDFMVEEEFDFFPYELVDGNFRDKLRAS